VIVVRTRNYYTAFKASILRSTEIPDISGTMCWKTVRQTPNINTVIGRTTMMTMVRKGRGGAGGNLLTVAKLDLCHSGILGQMDSRGMTITTSVSTRRWHAQINRVDTGGNTSIVSYLVFCLCRVYGRRSRLKLHNRKWKVRKFTRIACQPLEISSRSVGLRTE
jgi:hypothetical protein